MGQDRAQGQGGAAASLAEALQALQAFLVPGDAVRTESGRTNARPAALALAFADFAARLATLQLPAGQELSITVGVQPHADYGLRVAEREAAEVAIVQAAAAVLTPGAPPKRERVCGSVHYTTGAVTPGGLAIDVYTGVDPTPAERAALDRKAAAS